jgi:hypothetical protein
MQRWLEILALILLPLATCSAEPQFSQTRGFYGDAFRLSITAEDSSARILISTDGSDPVPGNGVPSPAALSIDRTTTVRVSEVSAPDKIITHTYVLPSKVWNQPNFPKGLATSYDSLRRGTQQFDWAMDPELLTAEKSRNELEKSLTSLPALCVSLPVGDFNYVYENHSMRGKEFERKASVELIYPATGHYKDMDGFHIDCGLRMHGGLAVDQARKKSFRLLFKKKYGPGKLRYPIFESAPNHAGSAVDRFDTLVLRAGGNVNWSKDDGWKHEPGTYLRDSLMRDSQIAASRIGSHSTFVHLFINGLYFGVYNIAERSDAKFMASYLGGEPDDYFAINHGGAVDGDPTRSQEMGRRLRDPASADSLIDFAAFSDYVLLAWLAGTGDWPWNNYYGGVRTSPAGAARFFIWDAEFSFWTHRGYLSSNPGAWVNPNFTGRSRRRTPIVSAWRALYPDPEFVMTFADRVYRQCLNDGPLSDQRMLARFNRLATALDPAIAAESMRWGDAAIGFEDDPRTKQGNWLPNCAAIRELIDGNADRFIKALRSRGYYPEIDPPVVGPMPTDVVEKGFELRLKHPNKSGDILFTTDGTDPRSPGGKKHSSAKTWSKATKVAVTGPLHFKARVLDKDRWSALCELRLFTESEGIPLRFTELMFAPPENEAFEFIEITNFANVSIDVTGFSLTGVDFHFAPGQVVARHQSLVIIPNDDPDKFSEKFPHVS